MAEVLITLAIIGVVAAMAIPSVIVNTTQQEFKTGLRKAVSVLNSSITMNLALEGELPSDNADLFNYLQQHMSVIKSTTQLPFNNGNRAFYTTDGMRFEMRNMQSASMSAGLRSHEFGVQLMMGGAGANKSMDGNCGSWGITSLAGNPPCVVLVDVNGDRKPNPANPSSAYNYYTYSQAGEKLIKDVFPILILNDKAVPYGVAAQKAMYQARR